MAVALVTGQIAGNSAPSGSTVAAAFPGNVTAGNLLVACGVLYNKVMASGDMSDSRANAWTLVESISAYSVGLGIWVCIAKDSGACTVTLDDADSSASDYAAIAIAEFSGASATKDDSQTASGSSTNAHHGTVTQVSAGVYVGLAAHANNDTACTPDGEWTGTIYSNNAGTNTCALVATYYLAAAGDYDYGWTYAASRTYAAIGATFPAATATSIIPQVLLHRRFRN